MPKSATLADSGWLPAAIHASVLRAQCSLQLLLSPGVAVAVSSTLPALRSPCLQHQRNMWQAGAGPTQHMHLCRTKPTFGGELWFTK